MRRWFEVLKHVWHEIDADHVSVVAAGMAFYVLLAVVPLLGLVVSLYGLVADAKMIEEQVRGLAALLPSSAWKVVSEQLHALIEQPKAALGLGLVVGLVGALWAVSSAAVAMIEGVNIAYDVHETRSFLAQRWLALELTIGMVLFGALSVGLVALLPLGMNALGLAAHEQWLARVMRWPVMLIASLVGLAIVYRHTPNRPRPSWRSVFPGSLLATLLWLAGSALFSVYVDLAAGYDKTYGSAAGIMVFMLWLYITCTAVLLGAELNSELECQAKGDSTARQRAPGQLAPGTRA